MSVIEFSYDDVSITIENDTERRVKFTYIDHDSNPELPVTVEPGSSRKIDFSETSGTFRVEFVYESITYEDTLYLSDGNKTYSVYLDSDSRLKVKLEGCKSSHPHRL
ncbi:MAG: hypothetical protein II516_08970 [Treponema sp.]|nr:hypothetical protein [Treponema sp.]